MKIIDSGTLYLSRPKTDGASAAFASVCALPSGRWLSSFRLAPAKSGRSQHVCISHSDDQGKTWSPPAQPFGPPAAINGHPGTWRSAALTPLGGRRVAAIVGWEDASDPLIPFFNEETEGIVDMKLFLAISEDDGQTFGNPRLIEAGIYRDQPTPLTGPMLVMPDGRWAAQFEVNQHYDDRRPWQHHSSLVFSSDRGATWGDTVDVHTDPQRRLYCWDQRIARAGDRQQVVALFWTFDRVANAYVNIHRLASDDSGRTWGELTDTGVPGQPARLATLDARTSVMVYVDRTSTPVIKARLSADAGKTFEPDSELLVHQREMRTQTWSKGSMQDAWAEMSAFSIGLPDAVALPDGDVLAVFYTGDHADQTDIAWARIRV